jgi:hypothetical protein
MRLAVKASLRLSRPPAAATTTVPLLPSPPSSSPRVAVAVPVAVVVSRSLSLLRNQPSSSLSFHNKRSSNQLIRSSTTSQLSLSSLSIINNRSMSTSEISTTLTPTAITPSVRILPTPVRSAEDSRQYRCIELANGLKCILVSDPTTEKAAAAMDVNVGHFSDPSETPGLAHFLEHSTFIIIPLSFRIIVSLSLLLLLVKQCFSSVRPSIPMKTVIQHSSISTAVALMHILHCNPPTIMYVTPLYYHASILLVINVLS